MPDPRHCPTDWAVLLLMVPPLKPVPLAVQVTLLMAMLLLPEIRSPWAKAVRVAVWSASVVTLAVTATGLLAGMDGTASGLALAKLIAVGLSVSWAEEARGAARVTT